MLFYQLPYSLIKQIDFLENSRLLQKSPYYINITKQCSPLQLKQMTKTKLNPPSEYKPSVIGVDLGSAFTKIAAVEKGVVDIITNQANLRQTPTIVGYGNSERLIGQAGNGKIKSNLNNTIVSPNRYLGCNDSDYVKQEAKFNPCNVKVENGHISFNVKCQGQEVKLQPQQIVAALITKIEEIIELNKLSNKYLSVSVPNYYSQNQRIALLNAIQIAKKSSNSSYGVQLVNQSTAVGLDYGFYKKNDFPEEGKNVLFVDIGHSKLSTYVINFSKTYQKVLYQKHIRQLGCRQLDELMLQFYSKLFEQNNTNMQVSIKQSKKATIKLLQNIERQRKILSGNSEYDFNIDCLLQQNDLSYIMKRQQFEQICQPAIIKFREFLNQVQTQMTQSNIKLSSIELIGGGTRIPIFVRTIQQIFEVEPSRTLNSNECIARGAGLYSAMESNMFRMQTYPSVNGSAYKTVCSWKGIDQQIQNQSDEVNILQVNQTLFNSKEIEFTLQSHKQKLAFVINQIGVPAGINQLVCSFNVILSPSDCESRRIKLRLQVDGNLVFSKVVAYELKQKEEELLVQNLTFVENLTNQQIKEFQLVQREQTLNDIKILKGYELKNKFQSTVYALKQTVQNSIKSNLKEFINPQAHQQISIWFSDLQNQFDQINNFEQTMTVANLKVKQYFDVIQKAKQNYLQIQSQLKKLKEFIESVIAGKIKSIRFYPREEFENIQKWLKNIQQSQNNKNKFQTHQTSVEQIKQKAQTLKTKIEECQAEQLQKERLAQQTQRNQYIRQEAPNKYYNDQYQSPFATSHQQRMYDTRNRGRGRNNSFNNYNSGFFPGFSGFF